MHHTPPLAFLWLGAVLSGSHASLLEKARYGSFDADLLTAAWTDTVHTFMQMPVSAAAGRAGRVRREDECRVLYLASREYQFGFPMSPWAPFGSTVVGDAELEVQIHASCEGHGLQYGGWAWNYLEDGSPVHLHVNCRPPAPVPAPRAAPISLARNGAPSGLEIPYEKLCTGNDVASSTATLNVFVWLRRGGLAASEQHIRRHEWLCEVLDEEEEGAYESDLGDEDGGSVRKRAKSCFTRPRLGGWLAAQGRRETSI